MYIVAFNINISAHSYLKTPLELLQCNPLASNHITMAQQLL